MTYAHMQILFPSYFPSSGIYTKCDIVYFLEPKKKFFKLLKPYYFSLQKTQYKRRFYENYIVLLKYIE